MFSLALTLSTGVKLAFSKSKQASKQTNKKKTPNLRSGLPFSEMSDCLTLQCGTLQANSVAEQAETWNKYDQKTGDEGAWEKVCG